MDEALWRSRLRWRWRGAMLWPAFAVAVVVDALLLELLPVSGDDGPGLFAAVLLAGFLNLVVVAVGAPLAGRLQRRRHPETPKGVAADQAGTILVALTTALVALLGLAHHPSVSAAQNDLRAQAATARRFVINQAPSEYQAHADHLNTVKQGPELYRTCVAGPDPDRAFCVFVNTDQSPPGVTRDPDMRPNEVVMRSGR
jgi:4-amino-4-deoxy-L-arabinose transferase-like glycosyltransferase